VPLREDLLNPIAGANPAGPSLRYDRVYDQIKDARTEEDDSLPSGGWSRQTKKADFRAAAKLAGDALATRSKDLQLAVWLGEALIKLEGAALFAPMLQLFLDLQQTFWETLHPEIDEGDAGMRAAPLQWAATRYTKLLNEVGLTRKGVGILEYKAARALGTEEEAGRNEAKRQAREEAVAAGKLTSEEVTDAITATPKSFYVALEQQVTDALNVLNELDIFCEEKYGDDSPSYRTLRAALEEVQNLVGSLLREKRKLDPDPVAAPVIEAPIIEEEQIESLQYSEPAPVAVQQPAFEAPAVEEAPVVRAAAAPARPKPGGQSATPESWEDALGRIAGAVTYLNAQKPESTLPFLITSAVRMAELYQLVVDSRLDSIPAPPTELRQRLKRAASDREWSEVHTAAITALATPCGSGWLDLYRYLWISCDELGWYTQRNAVASAVKQRLRDLPQLPSLTLNDDTPSANAETLRWIQEEIAPPPPEPAPVEAEIEIEEIQAPVPTLQSMLLQQREPEESPEIEDLFVTARGLAAHGQIQGAIQLLARDAAQQSVGRLRFNRNLQIAELCLESGNSAVAVPVLQGLVREVEERRLESWEPPGSAAKPYALLLQCASAAKLDTQSIFARLCAIDPGAALSMAPPIEN
jgi:type VI secretion system protein ImpA